MQGEDLRGNTMGAYVMTFLDSIANGEKREIVLSGLKSIIPMIIYDFSIKPLIVNFLNLLQISDLPISILTPDSLLIGFIAFLYIHLRRGRNIDLILDQADRRIIEKSIKIREKTEDERAKTRHGSEQWNELSDKIAFFDRHIGHYERRIKARMSSTEGSSS